MLGEESRRPFSSSPLYFIFLSNFSMIIFDPALIQKHKAILGKIDGAATFAALTFAAATFAALTFAADICGANFCGADICGANGNKNVQFINMAD
jgi:hypothetical protein